MFSQAIPGAPYEGICQVPSAPLNDTLISGCQDNSSLGVLVLTVFIEDGKASPAAQPPY